MRLIAESLLSRGRADTVQEELTRAVSYTFLQGELTRQQCVVPEPCGGCKHHIYCSSHNEGAADLMREVASHFNPELTIKVTEDIDELPTCERMLVYLTGLTWTSGAASDAFAQEVQLAMDAKKPLLLCHEMPGVGGQAERYGCSFELFFMHENGATPPLLLEADIYSTIATPLKGGAWRSVSMALVAQALAERGAKDTKVVKGMTSPTPPARLHRWRKRLGAVPIMREHVVREGANKGPSRRVNLLASCLHKGSVNGPGSKGHTEMAPSEVASTLVHTAL